MKPSQVNKNLIWDYDWDESEYDTEEFERWYVHRVITNGMEEDILKIGLKTIARYIDDIMLPRPLRDFWNWYLEKKLGFYST